MTAVSAISSGLERRAFCPVDGASIAAFRILFGLLGLATVVRFFAYGWIDALYIAPAHHFTYPGLGWAQPWPGWGMYAHFAALGLLSVGIAVGWRWRVCAALFGIGFTYVELLDQTTYLNHYYLVSLLAAHPDFRLRCAGGVPSAHRAAVSPAGDLPLADGRQRAAVLSPGLAP